MTTLLLCSAGLAAVGAGTAASLQTPASLQAPPVVRVESGALQGVVDDGVASFKGIPFAAPPVGVDPDPATFKRKTRTSLQRASLERLMYDPLSSGDCRVSSSDKSLRRR